MSTIDSIILVTSNSTHMAHDAALVRILNERLMDSIIKVEEYFVNVHKVIGGEHSFIDEELFVGTIKNFDEEDFRTIVRKIPWMYPEELQVLVRKEAADFYVQLPF